MATKAIPATDQHVVPAQKPLTKITQLELEEYIGLKNQIDSLQADLEFRKENLKNLLSANAEVEEGTHTATIALSFRRSVSWREQFEKLGDKFKGAGQGVKLAEKIIEKTEPTQDVRLTVR